MKCDPGCTCARHKKISVDLTDKRFGRLTAVAEQPRERGDWRTKWLCKCDCGVDTVCDAGHLTGGRSQSCGCLRSEMVSDRQRTHGLSKTPTYKIWAGMVKRCTNPNSSSWAAYGERGITVCKRWMRFEHFLADMGERPHGMSIERKNNNAGYSKRNCKWATHLEQMNNTRKCKPVLYKGRTTTVSMLARELGVNPKTALQRVRQGATIDQALGFK